MTASPDCLPLLLRRDEPRPFEILEGAAEAPGLVIADHASNFVPEALGRLGLANGELERHIAFDIGAAEAARALAGRLGWTAVLSHFSRLIVDPNRDQDDPTLIPVISDGAVVPGNRGLTARERHARIEAFYRPYHAAVDRRLDAIEATGSEPILVSVHSFTPMLNGIPRPWEVGILWGEDGRIALPLIAALEREGFAVGDNKPYSAKNMHGHTMEHHALARGIRHVLLELRQDQIAEPEAARALGIRIADLLREIVAEPAAIGSGASG